ncbi:class I glutamine amidotransferase-like protein [Mycena vitilis]|nr:class I glutamine amidotransferase-like protein [Mycena vitilis]
MSKRIALLVCDTLLPAVVGAHGDYPVLFTTLLHSAGAHLAIPDIAAKCTLEPFDVVKLEYPSDEQLGGLDGVLITGSKASAYEDVEWINTLVEFVKRVAVEKPTLKIVGICFGHQIIARALGGRCVANGGRWEVGPTPIALTTLGKDVFGVDSLYIEEMHQDHVPELPPTFHLLGSTDISPNQGMVKFFNSYPSPSSSPAPSSPISLADVHIFTVQGHPEFTEPVVSKLVSARTASGVLDAVTSADAVRRANWQNDGMGVVGTAILRVYGFA